jgi:integrase
MVGAIVATWKQKLSRGTAYTYRWNLQKLLGMLASFGAPPLRAPKVPKPSARATTFKGEELAILIEKAQPYMRLFILLYLQCGLRSAEAFRVSPRSWNPEQHTVTVKVKGERERTAAVTPEAEALFAAALAAPHDERPFLELLRGKPITPGGLRTAWEKHRQACHINPQVTAHDLRRTAASILYAATKDLRVPQQLLGHKHLTSTLAYIAPLAPDEARRYQELLSFAHFKSEVKQ